MDYTGSHLKFKKQKQNRTPLNRKISAWEKIFTNYTVGGLIARIYKELQKLSTKTPNHVLYDRAKEFNRQFSKEEMQMTNKYLKSVQHP